MSIKIHSNDTPLSLLATAVAALRDQANWSEAQITELCERVGWTRGFSNKAAAKFNAEVSIETVASELAKHLSVEAQ